VATCLGKTRPCCAGCSTRPPCAPATQDRERPQTNPGGADGGFVDDPLACHYRLTSPRRDPAGLPSDQQVIEASHTNWQSTLFIRSDGPTFDPAWTVEPVGLEDLMLAYMRRAQTRDRVREPHLGAVR
jgi:hypothetical protein